MRISRICIENFRNFANLDVNLSTHPDSARQLREEDFWDGLKRPLGMDDCITISVEITDFEDNENQLAVLAEHLVNPECPGRRNTA